MKIDSKGNYTPFYGWTLISNVIDPMCYNYIYNYIANNNILKKYFTALPIDSYHMTIYNIWCNGKNFLPFQENYIKSNFNPTEQDILRNQAKNIEPFNPNGFMDKFMEKIDCKVIDKDVKTYTTQYMSVNCTELKYTGSTLCMIVNGDFLKANKLRENISNYLDDNDNMSYYHITVAYQYKLCDNNEDTELIQNALNILNILTQNVKFNLTNPFLAVFNDMTKFTPCFNKNKEKMCITYLVPDKHTQIELKKYGFDITAPIISFKKNPTRKEKNTKFGGAHISILRRKKYTSDCNKELKKLTEIFKMQTDKNWSLPQTSFIKRNNFQSNIIFNCDILAKTAIVANENHIPMIMNGFHIGLYSSTLEHNHTPQQENDILNCLYKANWGFILSIDNGDTNFKLDWNTFIPV